MPDPSDEILPQRGQYLLSYGDYEYKDKDNYEDKYKTKDRKVPRKMGMYTGLSTLC